mmetsp:Transcript_62316/g.118229  ORF Transcript_62316/g.118229 Transcript_62316/m.118229 type:complete len:233 (+) Transcript_62316:70-768(+)
MAVDREKFFEVTLQKGGRALGFNFKKPKEEADVNELLVVAVLPGGVLGHHNATQAASGQWDYVVLPGMRINAVNGYEGDPTKMRECLRDCDKVTLRCRRSRAVPQSLSANSQRMLCDRVAQILKDNKERFRDAFSPAATADSWENTVSTVAPEVIREVSTLMQFTEARNNPRTPMKPGSRARPRTSPGPTKPSGTVAVGEESSFADHGFEPSPQLYPYDEESEDDAMSEESV